MNLEQLQRMRSLVTMQTPSGDRAQLERQLALQNIDAMIEQCKAKV